MPAVCRVAKRREIRIVRRCQEHGASRTHQSVKLFHSAKNIGNMFNDVCRMYVVEGIVSERVWETIDIANHVRLAIGVPVYANRPVQFIDTAANVQC